MSVYGIITLPIVPLRAEAKHASEQESQLLFGEIYQVLSKDKDWLYIKCQIDNYEGYIPFGQHHAVTEEYALNYLNTSHPILSESISIEGMLGRMHLSMGSVLPFLDAEHKIYVGNLIFQLKEPLSLIQKGLRSITQNYLNTSYLWGGKSQFGIDCSGFSQTIFRIFGKNLPRNASQQVQLGEEVALQDAKCGDLAFFINAKGKVDHVGILLSEKEIIHASHFVRIDDIDEKGIFNRINDEYSHSLFKVKRYF